MLNKYYVSNGDLLIYKSEGKIEQGGICYFFESYYRQGVSVIIPCLHGTLKLINNFEDAVESLKNLEKLKFLTDKDNIQIFMPCNQY